MKKLALVILLFSAAPLWADPLNWIVDGDFKNNSAVSVWTGGLVTKPGRNGSPAAYLENAQPAWSEVDQKITLPHPIPPLIEISGWLKTDNVVKGNNDWEMARMTVVFYDQAGNRLGDYPASTAQVQGTHDWTSYTHQYWIPAGTAFATVGLSLGNCSGKAWFSDLRCLVYDDDLKPLAVGQTPHPDLNPAVSQLTANWLLNPDFETPGSRDWGTTSLSPDGRQSLHSLFLENTSPAWTLAQQDVSTQGQTPVSILYSGWLKTEGVVLGTDSYMAARLGVDFRDGSGKQVGGWQDSVCLVTGTTPWTLYQKRYAVPPGTAQIHVDAGLGNCVGRVWVDDLSLTLLDAQGRPITTTLQSQQTSDTSDWYAYEVPPKPTDTSLDLSFLNDMPAGKHGFVLVKKGHFAFKNGTPIRFWGTDLVGPNIFVTHAQADIYAERLAKLGVNLVRLHMADADWTDNNFFDPQAKNTLTLKPESVDKFDYLISALKQKGVYVYPDWIVGRKFRAGDKVKGYQDLQDGAKGVIHFDPRIIELNQLYAKEILTHPNPYTGKTLAQDPVYVGNEIVNESSIFTDFQEQNYPKPYWDELQKMYEDWGGQGNVTHFKFDYDAQRLAPTQYPENAESTIKFLLQEVTRTNLEMKKFLQGVSPHALLTGSNMGLPVLGDIKSNAAMDFMDAHSYWDHPQFWNIEGGWANVEYAPMNNNSQLLNPFQGSLVFSLAQAAVAGKPLLITEWNDCFPNEYRIEGPVLTAVYGSLQDWDGFLQFDDGPEPPGSAKMTNFSINKRVDNEPLFQAGALIFRERLLKPSAVTVVEPLSDTDILANGSHSDWLFDHPWLVYAVKVVKRFTGDQEEMPGSLKKINGLNQSDAKIVKSSTGEESLDYGLGVLKVDSPSVQGFTGAIGTDQNLETRDMALNVSRRNPWVSVLAVSLDHRPIKKSSRILLFAAGRGENSGQVYNAARTALKNPGTTPVLLQGVKAGVAVRVNSARTYQVFPLSSSGVEGTPLKSTEEKGVLKFNISPQDHTGDYLIRASSH